MTTKEELRRVSDCLYDDHICLICDPWQYLQTVVLHPCERKNIRKRVKFGHRIFKAGGSIDLMKNIILEDSVPMSEIDEETDEEDDTKNYHVDVFQDVLSHFVYFTIPEDIFLRASLIKGRN